jgi:hypothetical protein
MLLWYEAIVRNSFFFLLLNCMHYRLTKQILPSRLIPQVGKGLVFALAIGFFGKVTIAQPDLSVQVQRWLQFQNLSGQVNFTSGGQTRAAQSGDRLTRVGDGVATGQQSMVQLALDTGIGFVDVTEQTKLVVQEMRLTPSQGRITRLKVTQGRAKLRLRRFTNPESRFEIETPAGISGVRGTEFGINVQPDGKTSVAVLEGKVDSSAQEKTVGINAGFQSFTITGEPPSDPVPLKDDPTMTYTLDRKIAKGKRQLALRGQVDTVNAVFVAGKPVSVDRKGQFVVPVPVVSYPKLQIQVVTPLGKIQNYSIKLL